MFVVCQALKSPRTPQLNLPHAEKAVSLMPSSSSDDVGGRASAVGRYARCCVCDLYSPVIHISVCFQLLCSAAYCEIKIFNHFPLMFLLRLLLLLGFAF